MSLRRAKSVSAPRNRNALEGDHWRSVGELKQQVNTHSGSCFAALTYPGHEIPVRIPQDVGMMPVERGGPGHTTPRTSLCRSTAWRRRSPLRCLTGGV